MKEVLKEFNFSKINMAEEILELREMLGVTLPYLEGIAENLTIAIDSPEVALLNGRIDNIRAALKKDKP